MKKVIAILLVFCLALGMSAMAVEPTENEMSTQNEMPQEMPRGQRPQGGMPGGRDGVPLPPGGVLPEGEMPADPQAGMTEEIGNVPQEKEGVTGDMETGDASENSPATPESQGFIRGVQNGQEETSPTGVAGIFHSYSTLAVSVVLLIAAFIFVKLYKRKQY